MTEEKLSNLESGLLAAMKAIDNQILREVAHRSPEQREHHGVQKWDAFSSRVERIASFLLNALGDDEIKLDSVLVLAQALTKSLELAIDDLGEEGLGDVRTKYCLDALEKIASYAERARRGLHTGGELM
jgi:hypothetical protein